ncbi:rubrerythrin [Solidesulfovibrio carbinolicus]|uniref:Rubrerythrin n=1 Tax=Solidesulfovibrio carbinolicus TaxID=296842 RepID=A0A4P6HN74_9BACT|nr:rubrerythrin family protein [Solidesulfovibrio carbinolicus]QAZ68697.1 rubrerythrin family protein [Solidesulfovibrio carbinolicus]
MKSLKGSKTEKNILIAFSGESQARNRYTYFASVAKKEGYEQISAIFTETADQEKEHAKRLFKYLEGGEVEITAAFPAGVIASTVDNLLEAAGGESYEENDMYPSFAAIADEEGYPEVADTFRHIAKAEGFHKRRYAALADNIKNGKVFKRDGKLLWRCRNCGYPMESDHAPDKCPACEHPKAYFEIAPENW